MKRNKMIKTRCLESLCCCPFDSLTTPIPSCTTVINWHVPLFRFCTFLCVYRPSLAALDDSRPLATIFLHISAYLVLLFFLFRHCARVTSRLVLLRHVDGNLIASVSAFEICILAGCPRNIPHDVTRLTIVLRRRWAGQAAAPNGGSNADLRVLFFRHFGYTSWAVASHCTKMVMRSSWVRDMFMEMKDDELHREMVLEQTW